MSSEHSFTEDEIIAEQWETLINLFNNNLMDFINKKFQNLMFIMLYLVNYHPANPQKK